MRSTERRWCPECKLMTLADHVHPADVEAVNEIVVRGTHEGEPLERLKAKGERRRRRLEARRQELEELAGGRLWMIPLSCTAIAGFSTTFVAADVQVPCRPWRLVVDPMIAPRFDVLAIMIGNAHQTATFGSIAASCFPAAPPKGFPINNLRGLPMIHIGQRFSLQVQNKTLSASDFSAVVYARAVRGAI